MINAYKADKLLDKLNKFEARYRHIGISEQYHEQTKLKDRGKAPDEKEWPSTWIDINFKGYPRLSRIKLPKKMLKKIFQSFGSILNERKSCREYNPNKKLNIDSLSTLLHFSAGTKKSQYNNWNDSKRFYPSGGARYPIEVYPIIYNSDIPSGVYHYNVKYHSLELLKAGNYFHEIEKGLEPAWIKDASMVFVITAVFGRTQVKYGERGYRHILIEAGHMAQNIYLTAASLSLGCCAFGGYADDILNELIDVDGINESIVYALSLGIPK